MIELRIHAFSWCMHHQQPVVGLTANDTDPVDLIWIGLTVEDASALGQPDAWPPCGRRRVHRLVSDILRATDSRLSAIRLIFNNDPILTAQIDIKSPSGANALGCSSVDALLLANEHRLPLMIDDSEWDRLQRFLETGQNQPQASTGTSGSLEAPPDVFRDFIESLDLDEDRPS